MELKKILLILLALAGCVPNAPENEVMKEPLGTALAAAYRFNNFGWLCGSGTNTLPPGTSYSVPSGTIIIDGAAGADWGIFTGNPLFIDATSDAGGSGTGTDIGSILITKDSTNLYFRISAGSVVASGPFTVALRPPGGTGSNDDTIRLLNPADSCGVVSATMAALSGGFEAQIAMAGCLLKTGASRTSTMVTVTSSNDTASCITPITW